jgi:hypothetical protein
MTERSCVKENTLFYRRLLKTMQYLSVFSRRERGGQTTEAEEVGVRGKKVRFSNSV